MKAQLIGSAACLSQPPAMIADQFSQTHLQLAETGSRTISARPDFAKLVGSDNRQMAEDNNRNFGRFMASLFKDFQPEVLVETVLWVFRAYRSHGFQSTYWSVNLNIWAEMIREEFPGEGAAALLPYYDWLIVNIPIFVKLADETPDSKDGHVPKH